MEVGDEDPEPLNLQYNGGKPHQGYTPQQDNTHNQGSSPTDKVVHVLVREAQGTMPLQVRVDETTAISTGADLTAA